MHLVQIEINFRGPPFLAKMLVALSPGIVLVLPNVFLKIKLKKRKEREKESLHFQFSALLVMKFIRYNNDYLPSPSPQS